MIRASVNIVFELSISCSHFWGKEENKGRSHPQPPNPPITGEMAVQRVDDRKTNMHIQVIPGFLSNSFSWLENWSTVLYGALLLPWC